MEHSNDIPDQSLWKKLIVSADPKDREPLNSIVIKIIEDNDAFLFTFLLDNGYRIDALNEKGQSALHYAFYRHSYLIMEAYLNWQLLKTDSCDLTDSNGLTHLHIVCNQYQRNILAIVKTYLKNGSDVNACCHSDPENKNSESTPLHFAVKTQNPDVVKLLLENGANVNAVDAKGRTPLHLACQGTGRFFQEVLELLTSSVNAEIDARDQRGDTPLLSTFDDYFRIELTFDITMAKLTFEKLIKNGANILAKNNNGDTILHLIIKTLRISHCHFYLPYVSFDDTKHAKFVEEVLKSKKELLEIKNNEGKTPLQLAVSMTSASVVKVLLNHKADTKALKIAGEYENIFCYPDMVPNFDIVQNIMNIIDLLSNEEFEFRPKDHLMIIKFLVHEVDVCDCSCVDCYDNVDIKAGTAIDYGTGIHAKQVLSKMKENGLKFDGEKNHLPDILFMIKTSNFYMDRELEEVLNTFPRTESFVLNEEAQKELARLKSDAKLKNGVKLYDLMLQHPFKALQLLKDDNFDCKLTDDFLYFKDTILGFVTKAIVRNYIVKIAHDFFPFTPLSLVLPELCFGIILSFLSNGDIFNLCATTFLMDSNNVDIAIQAQTDLI